MSWKPTREMLEEEVCCNRTPQTGGLNNRNLSLTVLEAGSPSSEGQQVDFL